MPGKAIISPKAIEMKAAIIESWIVEENPPSKNLMFIQPDLVEGSITYHPQIPVEEHPERNNKQNKRI